MAAGESIHRLVIVESPGKIERIREYLGSGYVVMASGGHIVDLPWEAGTIDLDGDFEATYRSDPDAEERLAELRLALADADELLLATDGDREGEAIAWHLVQVLEPTVPVRRMVFHEITRDAVLAAVEQTRELDMQLVQARETRRTLDWLVGFHITSLLQQRLRSARSAGRVQSPVLRMVVDRERERMAHRPASYSGVTGTFLPGEFSAELVSVSGESLATGRDFDSQGELKKGRAGRVVLNDEEDRQLADALSGRNFTVSGVERRSKVTKPLAPFDTGGLYQAAGSRMGWSQSKTKKIAQKLYERSCITYPRTDTVALSEQGVAAARSQAIDLFGSDAVPASPRVHPGKEQNAQEAHEAIRPTGDQFRTPDELRDELPDDEARLYELIWGRTVASQMVDAEDSATSVRLVAVAQDGRPVEFRASGTVTVREGFRAAYPVASGRKDPLPELQERQLLPAPVLEVRSSTTPPPPRYTENTLLEEMRKHGIGRPATYAETISKLSERGYVNNRKRSLAPTFLGMIVTRVLEKHFAELVDYSFTGAMEERLDEIASGEGSRLDALQRFWDGDGLTGSAGLNRMLGEATGIDVAELSTFPVAGTDVVVRVGRWGAYLERFEGDVVERVNLPDRVAPADVTAQMVTEMFARRELGTDPGTGRTIVARNGKRGPYVTEMLGGSRRKRKKARTASLDSWEQILTISLDDALAKIAAENVELGRDPETRRMIVRKAGRSRPYLTDGSVRASIPRDEEPATVTLDRAIELVSACREEQGVKHLRNGRQGS